MLVLVHPPTISTVVLLLVFHTHTFQWLLVVSILHPVEWHHVGETKNAMLGHQTPDHNNYQCELFVYKPFNK